LVQGVIEVVVQYGDSARCQERFDGVLLLAPQRQCSIVRCIARIGDADATLASI
jgi:hypothetical protein